MGRVMNDLRYPVVELRQYTLHPGQRDVLVDLFDREFVETQEAVGMAILGQFRDLDDPDRFVWLRGFPSLNERDRMKDAFYGGRFWTEELESIAMQMLESWDFTLCETSPGAVGL
jgi:hypothetical protein